MQIDLTTCEREPIHQPGSIQPHGTLLALERTPTGFVIRQASQNVETHFGIAADSILGGTLSTLLREEDAAVVERQLLSRSIELHPLYLRRVKSASGGESFDAIAHTYKGWYILELEPHQVPDDISSSTHDEASDLYRLVQSAVADLRSSPSIQTLCDKLAFHVRAITNFDRVMVYRFDEAWNGNIVSEERRDDLEPFLGLHYPAADIPRQARELYTRNWLRFIADRDYQPVAMVPPTDPKTNAPLDMSYCVLRSVSPIHLEYLRNMGVNASMSISLLRDGVLWGLVACHHYSPRRVPYVLRNAGEMLGQVASLQIAMQERNDIETDVAQKQEIISRLIDASEPGDTFGLSLVDRVPNIMSFVECTGAAVVMDNNVVRIGQTPSESDLQQIADVVCESGQGVYASKRFAIENQRPHLSPMASGVLAVSLTRYGRRAILWFRPEIIRTVNWAGDPNKSIAKGEAPARLSPRGSFALWKETVRGQSSDWTEAEKTAVGKLRAGVLGKLLVHADDVSRHNEVLRRVNTEREQILESERAARTQAEKLNKLKDEFVATLSHELRTPLNAIQGWAHLLRSKPRDAAQYAEGLEIIERNARIQAQMVSDLLDINRITSGKLRLDVETIDLPSLVEAAIVTLQFAAESKQITIRKVLDSLHATNVSGDSTRLQQIIWNLLSNAIKFTPKGGTIHVELRRVGSYIELSIRDNGMGIEPDFLPYVFDRFRQADSASNRRSGGLGLGLAIVRHLVEMHGGTIFAESAGIGQGSTFTVNLPVRAVTGKTSDPHPIANEPVNDCDRLNLQDLRALIVDDEPDARELVANVLADCGVVCVTAGSSAEAMKALYENRYDILVSDIGMPGEDGYALIRQVREMEIRRNLPKIPAIALTAYARAMDRQQIMLAGFQVHVAKPVEPNELLAVIASLTDRI